MSIAALAAYKAVWLFQRLNYSSAAARNWTLQVDAVRLNPQKRAFFILQEEM